MKQNAGGGWVFGGGGVQSLETIIAIMIPVAFRMIFRFTKFQRLWLWQALCCTPPFQPKAACFSGSEAFLQVHRTKISP